MAIFGVRGPGGNMETIVSAVAGALLWVVANFVYAGERRRGRGGFVRILAFCWGLPGTFFSLLLVEEGSQPVLEPPPDDEEALLQEVRRARLKGVDPADGGDRARKTEEGE